MQNDNNINYKSNIYYYKIAYFMFIILFIEIIH